MKPSPQAELVKLEELRRKKQYDEAIDLLTRIAQELRTKTRAA